MGCFSYKNSHNSDKSSLISELSSHSDGWHLDIPVDIQPVVLGGQDYAPVVHQAHVEALGVLDLGLEGGQELPVLGEHRQVEVVMVVGDDDLAGRVDTNPNGIIGDT